MIKFQVTKMPNININTSSNDKRRKRTYSENFNDTSNKISNNDKIFDYLYYLELIDRTTDDTYNEYKNFKTKALSIHYQDNNIIRLQEDSYVRDESYQNIKIQLDGFDEDGNLIYVIPFCHNANEVKINNISNHYTDYIQIVLNVLKIDKCVVYVYSFETYSNSREIRRRYQVKQDKYGWIMDQKGNDIYYVMQHVRTNVIKRTQFNMRKIKTINKQMMSVNVDKYITPTHKRRRNDFLDPSWIAASKTRNASLNDHFIDYCRVYNVRDINDTPEKRSFNFDPSSKYEREGKLPHEAKNFIDFLLTSGNHFEDKIITEIKRKWSSDFVKICDSFESRNVNNYKKTLYHMNKGTPIIHQAILYNYEHKVFGSADLLVRSDWLNKLVQIEAIDKKEMNKKAPKLNINNYHYRIIDIKFHKFHLNVDSTTIRNSANVKPFKNQLAIYNMALGEMQGYEPSHSYLLGKGWVLTRIVAKEKIVEKNNNPFNKLGIVDFKGRDECYIDQSLKHVDWLRELDASTNWTHDPPCNDKLYPNMCNQMDGIYSHVKKQMANKYKDITQMWNCSYQNRLNAFNKNVKSWDDPQCNSKILGIGGKIKGPMVDKMIKFHRDSDRYISVDFINNNRWNWRNRNNKADVFVDFETIGTALLESHQKTNIKNENSDFIFMIGIGWQQPDEPDKWNYKCLFTNEVSIAEELRILREFNETLDQLEQTFGINNVYHWSKAEPVIYNKANFRYGNIFDNVDWVDLLDFFKSNEIFIKGAYNFGLKSIATQMNTYGMIESNWKSLPVSNGLDAMFDSWKMYVSRDVNKDGDLIDNSTYKSIIDYNEIDCKTLFEIINYFKKNY